MCTITIESQVSYLEPHFYLFSPYLSNLVSMENVHLEKDHQVTASLCSRNQSKGQKQIFGAAGPQSGTDHQLMPEIMNSSLMGPLRKSAMPRNCWLCEGWTQQRFEIRLPDKFIGLPVSSVYVHLSFEDFKPSVM